MQRKGSAIWQGDLKTGKGTVSTDSGVLSQTQYSFSTRFESGKGHQPGRIDRGCACGLLYNGAVGSIGECRLDSGKTGNHGHRHVRQA